MDQGDGQTHEASDATPQDSAPAEVGLADGSPTPDTPTHETPTQDSPSQDTPKRGRKRAPVRVDAESSTREESPADAAAVAEPAPPREPLPSIADRVEAVILSTERPLSPERLAIALGLIPEDADLSASRTQTPASSSNADQAAPAKSPRARKRPQSLVDEAISRVDSAVIELNQTYEQTGRSFRIESVAGGYRVMTMSKYAPDVARLRNAKVSSKLSRPAIETLAIIAYKQPMTRAELEAIRGVSCGEVLKSLLERRLITIKGRAEELGRPMLYGTTRDFLDHFGLASIKDLPTVEELRASAGV